MGITNLLLSSSAFGLKAFSDISTKMPMKLKHVTRLSKGVVWFHHGHWWCPYTQWGEHRIHMHLTACVGQDNARSLRQTVGSLPTVDIGANVADGNPGLCTSPAGRGSVVGAVTSPRHIEMTHDSPAPSGPICRGQVWRGLCFLLLLVKWTRQGFTVPCVCFN